jgi:hypothetical protein
MKNTYNNDAYTAAIDPTQIKSPAKPCTGESLTGDLRMPATATDVAMLIVLGKEEVKSNGYIDS